MYEESEISSLGLEPVDQLAVEARHRLETLYTEEELNDYTKIAQNIKLAVTDLETQFGTLDINGGQGAVEVLPSSPVFLKNRSLNLTSTAESVAPRFEGLSTSSSYKSLGSTTDTTVLLVTESNK